MQIVKLNIISQARDIAEVNALVLRANSQFRYLFIPYLVDNLQNEDNNIRARIIVQKKSKNEEWEEYDTLSPQNLKKGEWFKIDIHPQDLANLLAYSEELKKIYKSNYKYDVFDSTKIMILDDNYSNIDEVLSKIQNNSNLNELFSKLSIVSNDKIVEYINNNIAEMDEILSRINEEKLNELYSLTFVKAINVEFIEKNMDIDDEEYWQQIFSNHPSILSNVFPAVIHLIANKPYLGGKSFENRDGVLSDLLYSAGDKNVAIFELKTPCCQLMDKNEYRANVYSPSKELCGAIVQAKNQKDTFMKNYYSICNSKFESYDPRIIILIGRKDKLNENQKNSFELFRRELKDIEIVTYDELIYKSKAILNSMK